MRSPFVKFVSRSHSQPGYDPFDQVLVVVTAIASAQVSSACAATVQHSCSERALVAHLLGRLTATRLRRGGPHPVPRLPRRLAATSSTCSRSVNRYRHVMNSSYQCADAPFPAEVDELLAAVARDGFTLRYCNGPRQPTLIVGTYDWGRFVDLVVIRDLDDVISARVPTADVTDIFTPEVIVWLYAADAQRALEALLDLPHPDHPQAPTTPAPAPSALHVPGARRCPVTVRPPSALAARARQVRLGAALLADTAEVPSETG